MPELTDRWGDEDWSKSDEGWDALYKKKQEQIHLKKEELRQLEVEENKLKEDKVRASKFIPEKIPELFKIWTEYNRHTREHFIHLDGILHYGDSVQDVWDWTFGLKGTKEWDREWEVSHYLQEKKEIEEKLDNLGSRV